jgi:hypothetical protein
MLLSLAIYWAIDWARFRGPDDRLDFEKAKFMFERK